MLKKSLFSLLAACALSLLSACAARPPSFEQAIAAGFHSNLTFGGNLQFTDSDGYLGDVQVSGQTFMNKAGRTTTAELSISSSGQSYLEDNLYCLSDKSGTNVYVGLTEALREAADPNGTHSDVQKAQALKMPVVEGTGPNTLLDPLLRWFKQNTQKTVFASSASASPITTSGTYTEILTGAQVQSLSDAFDTKPIAQVARLFKPTLDDAFADELQKAVELPRYSLSADYADGLIRAVSIKSVGWQPVSSSNADPYTGKILNRKLNTGFDLEITFTSGVSSMTGEPSSTADFISEQN